MTLVAALKMEGISALIGDFLITDGQGGTGHIWLSTKPNLNDPRYLDQSIVRAFEPWISL